MTFIITQGVYRISKYLASDGCHSSKQIQRWILISGPLYISPQFLYKTLSDQNLLGCKKEKQRYGPNPNQWISLPILVLFLVCLFGSRLNVLKGNESPESSDWSLLKTFTLPFLWILDFPPILFVVFYRHLEGVLFFLFFIYCVFYV